MTNDIGLKLLNMDEAASILGIKVSTLYRLCMQKNVTVIKIGKLNRFRMSDLQDFINKRIVERVD